MLGAPELEGRLSVGAAGDENRSGCDACRARPARPSGWRGSGPGDRRRSGAGPRAGRPGRLRAQNIRRRKRHVTVTPQKQRAALRPPEALAGTEGAHPLLAPAPGPASYGSPGSGRAEDNGSHPGRERGSPRETGRERLEDPAEYKCEAEGRGGGLRS